MDRTLRKSQTRNNDGERQMKILESYKEMMYQFINEADDNEGEGRINMSDPVMQKKGWYKDNPELTVGGVLKQGEKHPAYADAKKEVEKAKGKDSGTVDAGKLSGKSDFSRDGGDAQSEPKADKPAKTKPEDFTGDLAGDQEAGQLANRLAQEYPDDDPKDIEKELTDMGHGDLAKAIRNADSLEDKAALISKATEAPDDDMSDEEERIESEIENLNDKIQSMMNDYDPDTDAIMKLVKKKEDLEDKLYGESININGKKYREVKEDRADGKKLVGYRFAGKVYKNKDDAPVSDPTPVYESKKPKKHILKENYERFFGDR